MESLSKKEILECLDRRGIIFSRSLKNGLSYSTLDSVYEIFKRYENGEIQEHSMNLFKYGLAVMGIYVGQSEEELREKLDLPHC